MKEQYYMKTAAVFDEDIRLSESIKNILESRGMSCVVANTLPEAAYEIGRSCPDVVITQFEFRHGLNVSLLTKHLRKCANEVIILTNENPKKILEKYPTLAFAKILNSSIPLKNLAAEIA